MFEALFVYGRFVQVSNLWTQLALYHKKFMDWKN